MGVLEVALLRVATPDGRAHRVDDHDLATGVHGGFGAFRGCRSGGGPSLRGHPMNERIGTAGAGAIASGLAAVAALRNDTVLWARSDSSAERADKGARKLAGKLDPHAVVHLTTS